MLHPQKINSPGILSALGLATSLTLIALPVSAHRTEVTGSVGVTVHIEPNDTPKAGEPSLTWFALTRQGGESIALSACNCKLAVYTDPAQPDDAPVLEPTLKAIAAEGYTNIPGAEITFPQVGAYELVLSGEPVAAGDFQPFELRFPVIVATGQANPNPTPASAPPEAPPSPEPSSNPSEVPTSTGDRFLPTILSIVIFLGLFLFLTQRSRQKRG